MCVDHGLGFNGGGGDSSDDLVGGIGSIDFERKSGSLRRPRAGRWGIV